MAKEVIHISEAEAAATGIATLLKRVDEGAEIVIERESRPPAILSPKILVLAVCSPNPLP
jgi:hypothetical protein